MNWNPSWANAIASIESQGSGGYNAVGPVTQKGNRAYGKYQVMDFNIPSWTKKHLGQELTPDQFLRSHEAQDAVFKGEFGSSVAKYGNPQDAASVWFTGRPASEGANRSDILGTTGSKYVDKFNNALGTGATPTGGQQMMQPDQKPKGILSGLFGDEDKRARLAMALQGMTHNPNQGFMAAMQGGIEQRREDKVAATAAAKSEAQRNSTGKWLSDNGFKEIGAGVLSGAISGSAGLQMSQKAAPKTTGAEDKIARLVSTGVPQNIATGMVDGRLVAKQDPVTGDTFVFDIATGQKVFGSTEPTESDVPLAQPDAVEGSLTGLDPTTSTGLTGYANSWLNAVADAFGLNLPAPDAAEASAAMRSLATRTIALADTEFAGKPTNFLREKVDQNFSINPDQAAMGPRMALKRSSVIINMLQETVDGAKAAIRDKKYTVEAQQSAMNNLPKAEALLRDYKSLREALNQNLGNSGGAVQVSPDVQELYKQYTSPAKGQ